MTGAVDEGVQVELAEQNASGQSGTATLSLGADGTVHVAIELSTPPADPQPAHIHEGTSRPQSRAGVSAEQCG